MTYEDYLIHSSELRHFSFFKKKPKYYKKDGNRYYYSKAEWDAHLRNQQARQSNVDRTRADISSRRTRYGKPRETFAVDKQKLKSDLAANTTNKNKSFLRAEYKIKLLSSKWNKKFSEIKTSVSGKINQGKKVAEKVIADLSKSISSSFTSFKKNASDVIEKGKKYMESVKEYRASKRLADRTSESYERLKEKTEKIRKEVTNNSLPLTEEGISEISRARMNEDVVKTLMADRIIDSRDKLFKRNMSRTEFAEALYKLIGLKYWSD